MDDERIAVATDLPGLLEHYKEWCRKEGTDRYGEESASEGWSIPWQEPFITSGPVPSGETLALLADKFGALPNSYLDVLASVGSSSFRSASAGLLRILEPEEVLKLYENVQGQMDFADGLREEIQEEDGIDFSKFIPVMAGAGTDGYWGLLDLSSEAGQILYWDNDQAGYMEDVFPDLACFVAYLLDKAKTDNPPRLT